LKDIDFAYNTAGGKGGALYLSNGKISIEADEKDIVFRGNIANASSGRGASANDIHLYNNAALTFFASANKTISLSGGIVSEKGNAGENRIVKDGYGTLLLKDGSKIETVDSFLIREGLLKFEMPVEYSVMADMFAVFSDGALEISVDFKNKKASSIAGINTVNISGGAKLLIDVSESPINRGDKLPIIYANNATEPSAFNLTENGRYRFSFDWERGENFKYIGYLIYEGMKPIKNPVFYANIRTLPVRFFWDYGPLSGGKRIYIGDGSMLREEGKVQSAWIMADIFGLNHKSGESGIGDFKSSGRGVQAGYDLFRDGGVFISYQNINAEQDGAEAFIGDFELGLYKTINMGGFMLLNGMLSAGAQNFEVEGGAEFGAKSIKFLLETEHIGALSIANLFLSLRGGYIANEEINESGFIMEADGYLRTEFLGGAKRSYQINPFLSLGWKAYIGLPILTSQYRQTFKSEIGDIKGAESGNVFGGIGGRGEYKIKDNVNLFAGLSFEFDETFTAYTAYLGASLKLRGFSNLREEPKEVKLVEVKDEAEKAVEQEAPEAKAEISDSEMLEQAKQRRETAALSFRLSAALFEVDSWDLSEEANLNIEAIAAALKGFNITNLVVEGHTDSTGSDDINRPLSKNRAEAVLKALILNGVVTDKMESAGFGSLLPIVSNDNHESRRLNRRVEIFVEGSDRIEYSIPEDETSGAGIAEDNKTQNAAGEPSAPEQPKQDGDALKGQNAEVK
ncbi:MAG: OmpA family protein, partial [Elusimicrobiota bacterium]|nr:OmpA family protein [Elusimicrobiota bacterium]